MTNEIVPSVSVANMVNQRAAIMQRLGQAFDLINEAALIAQEAHLGMPRLTIGTGFSHRNADRSIADSRLGADRNGARYERTGDDRAEVDTMARLGVDCAAWQYLMTQSGLRSLMDATAREKWDKAVMDGDVPEFTEPNVRSTFGMLYDARGDMFERGVIAAFKGLSWDYKTNLPQKFGKRIVMRYLTGWHSHEKCNQLDDLLRVLHVLDGKPEPDCRGGVSSMLSKAGLTYSERRGECSNDYVHIRCFKNGNGHVTFKRLDLVERMNKIIAKHYPGALPAPRD